jgi:hypothetical protein
MIVLKTRYASVKVSPKRVVAKSPIVTGTESPEGFCAHARDHRFGEVDPVHADTARGERQRDPPRADTQLQRRAISRQLSQEIHGSLDDLGIAPASKCLVVARGDFFTKVVLGHESRHCQSPPIVATRQLAPFDAPALSLRGPRPRSRS